MLFPSFFNAGPATYEIEQSLRFDRASSHYLNETFAAGQNTWTVSFWVKRANLNGVVQCLFGTSTNGYYNDLGFEGSDRLRFRQVYSGVPSENFEMVSTMRFRDPSAWYHIVLSYGAHDGSAAADRAKIWVNNQRLTAFDTANYPGANVSSLLNANTRVHNIGKVGYYDDYLGAYIAEFNFIDGQRLDPDDFGEEDANGVWRPIKYTGTYGNNNSVYLKFDPTATNGIGHDHSGNGNHWTPTGFDTTNSTASTYDVMSDTPTTNWCTLNPVGSTAASQCSNGNLEYYNGTTSSWRSGVSTFAVSSGKWYFEAKFTSFPASSAAFVGISRDTVQWVNNVSHFGQSSAVLSYGYYSGNGKIYDSSSSFTYGASYTTNDVIGCALDLDAGTLHFYKNGTDQGEAVSGLTGTWNVGVSSLDTPAVVNFGQRAFAYTPPTGFKALNTSNLPAPTVKDGSEYFNTSLWTGTGSPVAVTGVGFQPDLVWVKARSRTADHKLQDSVRGSFRYLQSNLTNAENTNSANDWFRSFDSDGFTVAQYTTGGTSTSEWAGNGDTYVGWSWLAGGTGSSNTVGSITSTVSANPSAGFSIGTFTGTGAVGSIGHGLGVAPKFILIKRTNVSGNSWAVYHDSVGAGKQLLLNSQNGVSNDTNGFPSAPTSSVINVGTGAQMDTNQVGAHVFYAWSEVEGFSKFGTYNGNGSTDGPFVYTGFKPAWLMVKKNANSTDWKIYDTGREPYNVMSARLAANTSASELSGNAQEIDFVSNGFKFRGTNGDQNSSGTFYYVAFASNPFGGSGVSPATAR